MSCFVILRERSSIVILRERSEQGIYYPYFDASHGANHNRSPGPSARRMTA